MTRRGTAPPGTSAARSTSAGTGPSSPARPGARGGSRSASSASSATSKARTCSSSAAARASGRSSSRARARVVGLDNSERQLELARELQAEAGIEFPLVHAPAEHVPLPDASFDVVFCDHGAMSFADPALTLPEVARLLRPGGLLAFCVESPLHAICWSDEDDRETECLQRSYFDLYRVEKDDGVAFYPSYGEWIQLFRASGLVVEDLLELRPPEGAETTYGWSAGWARRWPAELLWRVRKP